MEKIKFIADSPCDIPNEDLVRYKIDMTKVPITIDGESYYERQSFSIKEFYTILEQSKELPKTSRVPAQDFLSCYERAYAGGYNVIIAVTINALGSSTNASAHEAKQTFFEENPDANGKITIHIVDSATYSVAYGYPVIQSAKMAEEGRSSGDILEYLEGWFSGAQIYLGCYSLEYARRSGRITAAAAFVGDMFGLRPIILMQDGTTKVVDKVRGDRQVVPSIYNNYMKNRIDRDSPVIIAHGSNKEPARELRALIEKETGRSILMYPIGASILINSGPNIVALICHARKRKRT
jgi:DegV family protein with EDD domain